MKSRDLSFEICKPFLCTVTTFVTLMSAPSLTLAQQPSTAAQSPVPQAQSPVVTTTTTEQEPAQKMPPEQLDSLVAPIALFWTRCSLRRSLLRRIRWKLSSFSNGWSEIKT